MDKCVPSTSGLISETMRNQTSKQESTASKESQKETKVGDSSKAKRYFTRQLRRKSLPADTVSEDETVRNDSPEISSCQSNLSVQIYEKFTDEYILRESLREVLGEDYKEIVGKLYAEQCKRHELFKLLCHDAHVHCKTLEELKNIVDGNNVGQEVTPNKKQKLASSEVQNNDDNTDVPDEEYNTSSGKIRSKARKFVLPPEYDPEDSKWTLKHREYKEGLVALIPKSKIYVHGAALRNCKKLALGRKSLASLLLIEVFRESALSICSLTENKANACTGTGKRPVLDEYARDVLLKFVDEHAVTQPWKSSTRHEIMNALRNKMQEMRWTYSYR